MYMLKLTQNRIIFRVVVLVFMLCLLLGYEWNVNYRHDHYQSSTTSQYESPQMSHASQLHTHEQVVSLAEEWPGVIGFYLKDLHNGMIVAHNEQTVFSGASVMKVAILLYTYTHISHFTAQQEYWLDAMIIESDNDAANHLLAAAAGGDGVIDALTGALEMNQLLQNLGLYHTYQYLPYGARDALMRREIPIAYGPLQEGSPPFTKADPVLRTTPAEMAHLFVLLDACSRGQGTLLAHSPETLSAPRCQEMLDRLARNDDGTRLRAGVPAHVRVEHKSGWIDTMQADVGIVRSDGGDFVVAIFLYQDIEYLQDNVAHTIFRTLAGMAWTAYNP